MRSRVGISARLVLAPPVTRLGASFKKGKMLFEREEKDEEEVEMVGEECASGKSYYRVAQNCVCV